MDDRKFLTREEQAREVAVIVGTRPGIIMLAPVIHSLESHGVPYFVIHTGQHYSPAMDADLFEDLNLPKPQFHLSDVWQKRTHGGQTAIMLEGCESALLERKPRLVLVNGDANTNLAAALAARKLHIAVGHIEAGERSFDWRMPEEHNRRIMDHISELLFASSDKAAAQLKSESVVGNVHVTGNTIVDASLSHLELAEAKSAALSNLGLEPNQYIVVTSHREENVDVPEILASILDGASGAAQALGVVAVLVAHPRTLKRLEQFGLMERAQADRNIILQEAVRYLDFLLLLKNARLVMTDSGGVQQEAYIHQRPAVTLRNNTEWIETLDNGGNRLSGAGDAAAITRAAHAALSAEITSWPEIFGDGRAADRIARISADYLDA